MQEKAPFNLPHRRRAGTQRAFVMNPLAADLNHLGRANTAQAPSHVQRIHVFNPGEDDNGHSKRDSLYQLDDPNPGIKRRTLSMMRQTEAGAGPRDYSVDPAFMERPNRNSHIPHRTAVKMSELKGLFNFLTASNAVENEYHSAIRAAVVSSKSCAKRVNCAGRNRYTDISPYDNNRVKLDTDGNDYINASWVDGYAAVHEYIGAQGPLPATSEHFWAMVWERHSRQIVMMTPLYEQGKVKCH